MHINMPEARQSAQAMSLFDIAGLNSTMQGNERKETNCGSVRFLVVLNDQDERTYQACFD